MNTHVYDKTDKGREEIATRKYQVPSKLRTLLVMIDGRNPLDSVMKNCSGLGLTQDSVDELLAQQYITLVKGEAVAPPPVAARPPAMSARARMAARARAAAPRAVAMEEIAQEAEPELEHVAAPVSDDEVAQIRALHDFYNQTIKSTIGLRGLMLQLKAEKAASVDELRELRLPYLQAVLKSKGRELALSLRDRLDLLLGGKPEYDEFSAG
ncbi:MAG: hypothetical protein V4508_15200 [Pseudomonadota bacterium]